MDAIQQLIQENKNGFIARQGIIITGYKQHGKGTVCEMVEKLSGLKSASSSRFALDNLGLYDRLAARGLIYDSPDAAYADRNNHRDIWFQEIRRLTFEGDQRLGRELFAQFPVYDGMRNREELLELVERGTVRSILWVDASQRCPPESVDSMTLSMSDATHVIDNNGSLGELFLNVSLLVNNHIERS